MAERSATSRTSRAAPSRARATAADKPAGRPRRSPVRATVEQAIEDLRAGRSVIITDDENRENEGDVVIAAQFCTPEVITFFARYAKGLICAPLTEARADALDLPPMTTHNTAPLGTAFTVSVEAASGVTTGISAADRARTVQVLIDPQAGAHDLTHPGHTFPLRARDGGVQIGRAHV